ncbi:MAG: PH domain-containing protein [Micropruina sp.]|nr:PH domain-containing protein [Micropruina sp.]
MSAGEHLPPSSWQGTPTLAPLVAPPVAAETVVERPHPLTPLVRGWILLVAAAWMLLRDLLPDGSGEPASLPPLNVMSLGIGVAVLGSVVWGFLEWKFTRFVVDDNELRIESGFLTRTSQRIRFDRIQSIDMTQPAAARLLGLAELTIDVGGEGGTRLRYLTRQRATAMRDYLLIRAHGYNAAAGAPSLAGALDDLGGTDEILIRVPPQRLLVGALLSHELLLGLIPILIVLVVGLTIEGNLGASPWILLGPMIPILLGVGGFVSKRVIGQWNYTLARSGPGLKIVRGLTSLTSQSVPRHRIQGIRIVQPLWWRKLGYFRMDVSVIGYGSQTTDEDQAGTSTILLPIGTAAEVAIALQNVWPGLDLDAIPLTPAPSRSRWLAPFAQGWLAFGVGDGVIVSRTGWLSRARAIAPHARLQSLKLTQGPLQRRIGLASVQLQTGSFVDGAVIKHTDAPTARALVLAEIDRMG